MFIVAALTQVDSAIRHRFRRGEVFAKPRAMLDEEWELMLEMCAVDPFNHPALAEMEPTIVAFATREPNLKLALPSLKPHEWNQRHAVVTTECYALLITPQGIPTVKPRQIMSKLSLKIVRILIGPVLPICGGERKSRASRSGDNGAALRQGVAAGAPQRQRKGEPAAHQAVRAGAKCSPAVPLRDRERLLLHPGDRVLRATGLLRAVRVAAHLLPSQPRAQHRAGHGAQLDLHVAVVPHAAARRIRGGPVPRPLQHHRAVLPAVHRGTGALRVRVAAGSVVTAAARISSIWTSPPNAQRRTASSTGSTGPSTWGRRSATAC
ncbi:hypothetical protein ON010_g18169 [Phytophthora cinnamomi]|nr:hypothetical protein ON010_g18169 [Phytophthora cinnamomi]